MASNRILANQTRTEEQIRITMSSNAVSLEALQTALLRGGQCESCNKKLAGLNPGLAELLTLSQCGSAALTLH